MDELDDDRSSAVREALGCYAWRSLEPDVLAPVGPDDIRITPVTEFLGSRPWRGMPLASLVTEVLGVLHTWWFRWQWRLGDENARSADEDA